MTSQNYKLYLYIQIMFVLLTFFIVIIMKTKLEILDSMFRHLVSIGAIKTQQDIVDAISGNKSNVSSAFNGDKRYLTLNLLKRINKSFENIFNTEWIISGEGVMLKKDTIAGIMLEALRLPSDIVVEAKKEIKTRIKDKSEMTGYYFPEISASAGLDVDLINDTVNKIAVTIPNWEKELIFINVYGDSMYPKYNAGEVIGVKMIEYEYLNYGYPYVVVFKNGDTYIKIVQPCENSDFLVLESINPFYKSKEFHLSLIKHFYSIKGVIKREMI